MRDRSGQRQAERKHALLLLILLLLLLLLVPRPRRRRLLFLLLLRGAGKAPKKTKVTIDLTSGKVKSPDVASLAALAAVSAAAKRGASTDAEELAEILRNLGGEDSCL